MLDMGNAALGRLMSSYCENVGTVRKDLECDHGLVELLGALNQIRYRGFRKGGAHRLRQRLSAARQSARSLHAVRVNLVDM